MKSTPNTNTMEETIETCTAEVENIRLTYTLFTSPAEYDGRKCYSLTVTAETNDEITSSTAHDITRRRKDAIHYFRLITRGLVTPCTLFDILEDNL